MKCLFISLLTYLLLSLYLLIIGETSLRLPELSRDFTNPLNFKISHCGPLDFELLLIIILPLILTVKNTKNKKKKQKYP